MKAETFLRAAEILFEGGSNFCCLAIADAVDEERPHNYTVSTPEEKAFHDLFKPEGVSYCLPYFGSSDCPRCREHRLLALLFAYEIAKDQL